MISQRQARVRGPARAIERQTTNPLGAVLITAPILAGCRGGDDEGASATPILTIRGQFILEIGSMNFSALAARCARVTPSKRHVALPLLIMGVLYWISSLPGTPLPDDPALYAVFYWVPPSVQNALHVPAYAPSRGHCAGRSASGCVLSVARAIGACAIASAYGVFGSSP